VARPARDRRRHDGRAASRRFRASGLLERNNAHLVYDGVENLVGGLTLAPVQPGIASIGIIVRDRFRNMGVGTAILHLAETKLGPTLGIRVLRADVYADNEPMLQLLAATGFREYRNFEKNLPVDDASTPR